MDFMDPTVTKIKQECEDINADVPDFVKIESGEVKALPLNKFEFGVVKVESDVKDLPLNKFEVVNTGDSLPNTVVKQEIDKDVKVSSLKDLPLNKFEYVDIGDTDVKQEMDIDIKVHSLKTDDCFEKKNSNGNSNANGQVVTRRPLTCQLCGLTYFDTESYMGHMLGHTREGSFKCDTCNTAYKSEELLAIHMKMHTDSSDSSDSGSSDGNHSGSDSEDVPPPVQEEKEDSSR